MRRISKYLPRIKSRHPSHDFLRPKHKSLPYFDFKSIIRFGSQTDLNDTVTNGGDRIELNTIEAITNSSNKYLMKECFTEHNIITAKWYDVIKDRYDDISFYDSVDDSLKSYDSVQYPIITKNIFGSKGKGNQKHDNIKSFEKWIENHKDKSHNYIVEQFYNYNREYRLHVTEDGCFYTCRKMLKSDTPKNKRWYRNDDNSVWIVEENEMFDKPVNWDEVVEQSVNALKSVGLDFGAIDLRIQSAKNKNGDVRKNPKFIVVEVNSAPGLGSIGEQKYLEMIPKLLKKK